MSSKGYNLMVDDDQKKMKRMMSNRESAKRSRVKKEKHMQDLNDQILYFRRKRDEMVVKMERMAKGQAAMEMENMVLRSQKHELEKRLEYAKTICDWYVGDDGNHHVSMASMQGVVQEPWLRPWEQQQPSSTSMPVMSSAGFFQF